MVDELSALGSLLQRTPAVERRIAELAAAIFSSDLGLCSAVPTMPLSDLFGVFVFQRSTGFGFF